MRVLAVVAGFCALASAALAPRNCKKMPQGPDPNVRNEVYRVALEMGANDKVILATMAAAITETWVNNLSCGDQDSLGVFQQRPSQGWGSPAQLLDVEYSTKAFVTLCMSLERTHPGIDAGVLAQLVQRAQAGNQYTKNEALARQYIALAAQAVGKPAPAPAPAPAPPKPAPEPTKSTAAPKPSKTTAAPKPPKTTAAPTPKPPKTTAAPSTSVFPTDVPPSPAPTLPAPGLHTLYKPDGAPMTVLALPSAAAARFDLPHAAAAAAAPAPKTKMSGCARNVTPHVGESCAAFAAREGIALDQLQAWNPRLDANCLNLDFGTAYCVEPASA